MDVRGVREEGMDEIAYKDRSLPFMTSAFRFLFNSSWKHIKLMHCPADTVSYFTD